MGVARRIAQLYEARVNALLDRAEDPGEMLDYSYQRQQELLIDVRRGIVTVATSRRRASRQADDLESGAAHMQQQAEQAAAAGADGLARQALSRHAQLLARAAEMRSEAAALKADEDRLTATAERLRAKTEAFGLHKEVLKAGYTTAHAVTATGQAFSGISEEMEDVGQATRRAEDKTQQAQARADAMDDLLASGALGSELPAAPSRPTPGQVPADQGAAPAGPGPSPARLQEQLDEVITRAAVDEELARIKQGLATGQSGADAGADADGSGTEEPGS